MLRFLNLALYMNICIYPCRDIKGGNVLVDDMGRVKLADFGASSQRAEFEETQATQTMQGTPFFMAP